MSDSLEPNFDVGGRLRQLRLGQGLSQREVARRAGMTNANLSLIEQGKVSPSLLSLEKILRAFPLSLSEFFGDSPHLNTVKVAAASLPTWQYGPSVMKGLAAQLSAMESLTLASIVVCAGQTAQLNWQPNNRLVMGILLDGQIELKIDDDAMILQPGDMFRFSAHRRHGLANAGTRDVTVLFAAYQSFA